MTKRDLDEYFKSESERLESERQKRIRDKGYAEFFKAPVGETRMTVKYQKPRDIESKYGSRKVFRISVDGKEYDFTVNEKSSLYRNLVRSIDRSTPAMHTKAYFKDIVYRYGIDRAVQDGWLVDHDIVRVKSGIQMRGMFLRPGEHIELIDTSTGKKTYDTLEDEREFDSSLKEIEENCRIVGVGVGKTFLT